MAPTGPTVSKSKTNHKVLLSESIYETVKDSYEYMIRGFSLAKGIGVGKYKESRRFGVGGHDWVILFYPDGNNESNKKYVSVFLKLASPGEVRATVQFKLLYQTENGKHDFHDVHRNIECPKTFNSAAVHEPRELSDSDSLCTSTTLIQHLLAAADRYDIARLKLMCEAKLCEEITVDNVATTLDLAEKHQCLQLKAFCLDFAAKPENLGEVMKSDGYAYLEKSSPSLLTDLLKNLLTGMCIGRK